MILFLGPDTSPIYKHLCDTEPRVIAHDGVIDPGDLALSVVTFIVSHGYRHLIRRPVLDLLAGDPAQDRLPTRVINCHVGYLPWNKGADPNLWSWLEDTPKGVSIHMVDEGLDTGPIIARRPVDFGDAGGQTLRTTYDRLQRVMLELFVDHWSEIREDDDVPYWDQSPGGSFHKLADRRRVEHLLTAGWDTPVSALADYAADRQMAAAWREQYAAEVAEVGHRPGPH